MSRALLLNSFLSALSMVALCNVAAEVPGTADVVWESMSLGQGLAAVYDKELSAAFPTDTPYIRFTADTVKVLGDTMRS